MRKLVASSVSYLKPLLSLSLVLLLFESACTKKNSGQQAADPDLLAPSESRVSLISSLTSEGGAQLSWNNSALPVSGYLVVREELNVTHSTIGPVTGEQYVLGQNLGTGTIVYLGNEVQFKDSSIDQSKNYKYFLYSYVLENAINHYFFLDTSTFSAVGATIKSNRADRPNGLSIAPFNGGINLTWTSGGMQAGFLLLRRANSPIAFAPSKGAVYYSGQDLGDGVVVEYVGTELSFSNATLPNKVRQYYALYSFNEGYTYSSSRLAYGTPQASILGQPAMAAQAGDRSIQLSWYPGDVTNAAILLLRRTASGNGAPEQGVNYSVGNVIGNQTVIYVGNGTSFLDTELTNKTTYYYSAYLVFGNVYKYLPIGASATPMGNVFSVPPASTDTGTPAVNPPVIGINGGGGTTDSSGGSGTCATTSLSVRTPKKMTAHPGVPFPWEGAISKNLQLKIPAGLDIVFNSYSPNEDFGLGTRGLKFAIDARLKIESSTAMTKIEGDGSESYYQRTSCSPVLWESSNVLLSRSSFIEREGKLIEKTFRGGMEYEYTKIDSNTYALTLVKDANGNTMTLNRNEKGQIIYVIDSLKAVPILITYYENRLYTIQSACGGNYVFEYDLGSRLNKVSYPDSTNMKLEYADGTNLITAVIGRLGEKSQFRYNSDNSLKSTVNPYNYLTNYTYTNTELTSLGFLEEHHEIYNSQGALIQSIDNGVNTVFGRDSLNKLISSQNHLGQLTKYTYNSKHFLISLEDATGVRTALARDNNSNITRSVTTGPTGVSLIHTYTYDSANRLKSDSSSYGVTNYNYDDAGNVISVTDDGQTLLQASYDSRGLPIQLTDSYGIKTTIGYDNRASVSSVSNAFVNHTQSNTACGQPISVQSGGISSDYSYDASGRVVSESHQGPSDKTWSSQTTYAFSQGTTALFTSAKPTKNAFLGLGDSTGEGSGPVLKFTIESSANGRTQSTTVGQGGVTQIVNGVKTYECERCKEQSSPVGN